MMNPQEYVAEAFWGDCLGIAQMNALTGEYEFLKAMDMTDTGFFRPAETIFGLMRRVVESGMIHPGDVGACQPYMDKDAFARLMARPGRPRSAVFRLRQGGRYMRVTMEILVPRDFSATSPTVLLCLRETQEQPGIGIKALQALSESFRKILWVDLTEDRYEAIRLYSDEVNQAGSRYDTISQWFCDFAAKGNVPEADRAAFLAFTALPYLRSCLRQGDGVELKCRYRRRVGSMFRWVEMTLLPAPDYTDEHQVAMLYVREMCGPAGRMPERRRDQSWPLYPAMAAEALSMEYGEAYDGNCAGGQYADVMASEADGLQAQDGNRAYPTAERCAHYY